MKHFLLFLLLALMISCRSHKEIQNDISLKKDSVATASTHRTIATIDSVVGSLNLSFDTLEIGIQQQADETPKIIRIRAVNGKLDLSNSRRREAVEIKSRLDSTAYNISSADKSSEQYTSSKVYNPPDTTIIVSVAVVIAAILLFFIYYRKR